MKKTLLFLILAIIVNSVFLFSDEPDETNGPWLSESWASLGYEHGFFFESSSDGKKTTETFTSSPGISFGGYRFFYGMNVGIFVDVFFGFPALEVVETGGISRKSNFNDSIFNMQTGLLIGPGFRIPLGERANFKFAVGVGFMLSTNIYTEYVVGKGDVRHTKAAWNFGIGGDYGVKIDISDMVFLSVGNILTYDFASHLETDTPNGRTSDWVRHYSMISTRIYVTLGMNLYWGYDGKLR